MGQGLLAKGQLALRDEQVERAVVGADPLADAGTERPADLRADSRTLDAHQRHPGREQVARRRGGGETGNQDHGLVPSGERRRGLGRAVRPVRSLVGVARLGRVGDQEQQRHGHPAAAGEARGQQAEGEHQEQRGEQFQTKGLARRHRGQQPAEQGQRAGSEQQPGGERRGQWLVPASSEQQPRQNTDRQEQGQQR